MVKLEAPAWHGNNMKVRKKLGGESAWLVPDTGALLMRCGLLRSGLLKTIFGPIEQNTHRVRAWQKRKEKKMRKACQLSCDSKKRIDFTIELRT